MRRTLTVIFFLGVAAFGAGCVSDDASTEQPNGNRPAGTSANTADSGGPNDIDSIVAGATFVEKPTAFYGSFDTPVGSETLTVKKGDTVYTSGWAILPETIDVPKLVIVTYGDNKTIPNAALKLGLSRPDAAKIMNQAAYTKSGWSITFPAQALPEGDSVIKAWVYDSAKKQFFRLPDYKGEKQVKVVS